MSSKVDRPNVSEAFDEFIELVNTDIESIEPEYMKFEAVGLLDGFTERTYAYEFYHQLRKYQKIKKYTDFVIHAEPQKARTRFFKKILEKLENEKRNQESVEDFQRRVTPDILVHVPGEINNNNIAIVEMETGKIMSKKFSYYTIKHLENHQV